MRSHLFATAALAALLAGLASEAAQAVDARVLPKGRSRFSMTYGVSDGIRDVFNSSGDRESAVKDYNIPLSAANFQSALPQLQDLINYLNNTGYHYNSAESKTSSYGITTDPNHPLLGDALERGFLNVGGVGERQQYNLCTSTGCRTA